MALAAGTVWEANSSATASNVNGGGFNYTNANMATDLACDTGTGNTSSPVVSSASYNFVAADVGYHVYIKSGTNWVAGWYEIASVATNKATLKAAVGEAIFLSGRIATTNTSAGCATTGTPTGGTWTIDYSQKTACINGTTNDLASANATTAPATVTSASFTFGVNTVGNIIRVNAGTSWTVGWYEVVSVSGGAATLDRAVGAVASISAGTWRLGGALSMNSTLDDDIHEAMVGGNVCFVKGGSTFTMGEAVSVTTTTAAGQAVSIVGYYGTRNVKATGTNRPTYSTGANGFTVGGSACFRFYNMQFTGTGTSVLGITGNVAAYAENCYVLNNSTTATRSAISFGTDVHLVDCEAVSIRGYACAGGSSGSCYMEHCVFHNSTIGFRSQGAAYKTLVNCIIYDNETAAIATQVTALSSILAIQNCTLYGFQSKFGDGLNLMTGTTDVTLRNSIITGFVNGVTHADSNTVGTDDGNTYYNNTNDVSSVTAWQKGPNSIALDPSFTSVTVIDRTGATSSNTGNTLTDSGATFVTSGVTAGTDYVYISAGGTVGMYVIISVDSETQLTLGQAPSNATGTVAYHITMGRNWGVGTNLKAAGYPTAFQGSSTVSYIDIGAVQRVETSGGGGLAANPSRGFIS